MTDPDRVIFWFMLCGGAVAIVIGILSPDRGPVEDPQQRNARECAEACGDRGGKVWRSYYGSASQCICGPDRGACYPVPVGSAEP